MAADVHNGGSPPGAALEQLAQVIRAGEGSDPGDPDGVVHIDMAADEEYFEDELHPGEDDGTQTFSPTTTLNADRVPDEDNEVDYENDVVYDRLDS